MTLAAVLALSGCATYFERVAEARYAWRQGDYRFADEELRRVASEDDDSAHLYRLERAVVQLCLGRPDVAEELLSEGLAGLDERYSSSFVDSVGAMLLDDRSLEYGGEDYEHVIGRALLAVANLMAGGRDVAAYANAVIEKQLEIMDAYEDHEGTKPKLAYKLVPFGVYLRAILAEESPLKTDVARREFARFAELQPDFPYAEADIDRVENGIHSAPGNGVIHVIALVGTGPTKVETEEPVSGAALAIAQYIWAIYRRRVVLPNITAVVIPTLAFHRDNPTAVQVSLNGDDAGITATATDVDAIAREQFVVMRDAVIARAVLRRAIKIAAVEGTKEAVNRERDPVIDLFLSIFGLIWTGAERADTRGWSFLPSKFQVLRVEAPAGDHELSFQPLRGQNPVGRVPSVRVRVRDGFNSYVVVQVPSQWGGPQPLTSEPVEDPGVESPSESVPAAEVQP